MDAKEISMFRFLDGADKKFIIPVYQRAYSWKRENCASLLKDLMNVYEHDHVSHFFGSIVYISTEWFDESRKDLIEWYEKHL